MLRHFQLHRAQPVMCRSKVVSVVHQICQHVPCISQAQQVIHVPSIETVPNVWTQERLRLTILPLRLEHAVLAHIIYCSDVRFGWQSKYRVSTPPVEGIETLADDESFKVTADVEALATVTILAKRAALLYNVSIRPSPKGACNIWTRRGRDALPVHAPRVETARTTLPISCPEKVLSKVIVIVGRLRKLQATLIATVGIMNF